MSGWIGVDLDGTLAEYKEWVSIDHVGAPIPAMVNRVKRWLAQGREVRIFTARMSDTNRDIAAVRHVVELWCAEHIGQVLPVTNVKDFGMIVLYDDRCVAVEKNTGALLSDESW